MLTFGPLGAALEMEVAMVQLMYDSWQVLAHYLYADALLAIRSSSDHSRERVWMQPGLGCTTLAGLFHAVATFAPF